MEITAKVIEYATSKTLLYTWRCTMQIPRQGDIILIKPEIAQGIVTDLERRRVLRVFWDYSEDKYNPRVTIAVSRVDEI